MALDLGGSDGLDDMEVQTLYVEATWDTDELTGSVNTAEESIEVTADVAGGLARDEVAELVYVRTDADVVAYSTTETVDTAGGVEYELSAEPEPGIWGGNTQSDVPQNGVGVSYANSQNPSIIDFGRVTATAGFEDSTSGVGGAGASGHAVHDETMRANYGAGPTFDRHNDLFIHLEGQNYDIQDGEIDFVYGAKLVWDIHDRQ